MGKKKDKRIKELEKKIKELESQGFEEEEEMYVLSEAMIMSNAINDEIPDLKLLMGIDRFDISLYQRIYERFMDGMVKAGYIQKNGTA